MEEISKEMSVILKDYYADEAKKLHNLVDKIVNKKFGGTRGKDMSSYYSSANEVMADIAKNHRYDPSKGNFEQFLRGSLAKAFIDDYKYDNRDKRRSKIEIETEEDGKIQRKKVPVPDIYLDAPAGESEDYTIGDMLPSGYNLEEEVIGKEEEKYSGKILLYLNRLSKTQKEVLKLTIAGYKPCEIREKLHISGKEYSDADAAIHAYRNISLLF